MDSTSTWIGTVMILVGVASVFTTHYGISHISEMGMQVVSVLPFFLGIIFFAGGLMKGGPPSVRQIHFRLELNQPYSFREPRLCLFMGR